MRAGNPRDICFPESCPLLDCDSVNRKCLFSGLVPTSKEVKTAEKGLGRPEVAVKGRGRGEIWFVRRRQDNSFGMPAASPRQATEGRNRPAALKPLSLSLPQPYD